MYDDHMYCDGCGKHARDCWCAASNWDAEINDGWDCLGGLGHGYNGAELSSGNFVVTENGWAPKPKILAQGCLTLAPKCGSRGH